MPRPRQPRLETANQLVLPLRPGIETLVTLGNGKVHALIETRLEMQPVELIQAAPVAAKQAVTAHQAQGHGHISPTLAGHHHAHSLGHAFGQQAEKLAGQVRRPTAYRIGVGVTQEDEVPLCFIQFVAPIPAKVDALPRHLLAFLAHLLALARAKTVEKVLKVAVTVIAPMKLAPQPLHPPRQASHLRIQLRVGEVDVRP